MTYLYILLTIYIDNSTYYVYHIDMVKHMESGISGKGLGFHYLQQIKNLAVKFRIKGIVFTRSDGSIRVEAEGEEKNLMDFVNKLELESNSCDVENFYTKWSESKKDLESFHVVIN